MKGIRSSPARSIVSSRRDGSLSGEAQCGPPLAESRSAVVSSMIPIDAETGRSATRSSRLITPGFRCGSSPVSSSTSFATAAEVLERRLAAERRELGARDLVAELGLVAEREERLGAPGRRAGARDREHLLLGQERTLAAPRRPREGAVAADVAAERRQRDEDLRRVGDEPAAAPPLARRREQFVERRPRDQRVHTTDSLELPRGSLCSDFRINCKVRWEPPPERRRSSNGRVSTQSLVPSGRPPWPRSTMAPRPDVGL